MKGCQLPVHFGWIKDGEFLDHWPKGFFRRASRGTVLMLFEYAVEPKLVGSNWANARYWLEKFGFDRGRLISKFPNKWQRKVLEAARDAGMGDVHYKSLVEKLSRATQDAIASFDRHYDPSLGAGSKTPFTSIISGRSTQLSCRAPVMGD